jgi:hypothetical protein
VAGHHPRASQADADDDYEHDLDAVDGAVSDMFERFNVWRAYCDPHWIEGLIEGWQNRYGDKRVVQWLTNRPRPIAWAIRNFEQAIAAGDVSHDGNDRSRSTSATRAAGS